MWMNTSWWTNNYGEQVLAVSVSLGGAACYGDWDWQASAVHLMESPGSAQ